MNKLMRGGGGLIGLAQSGAQLTKDKLSFRGIVDILDVVAVDTGGGGKSDVIRNTVAPTDWPLFTYHRFPTPF
jgi:hypothetical protein